MAEIQYARLTRARLRSAFAVAVTSRTSLWLGPDHLLVIDTNGYTENYKRFYFRDIQAITLAMSKRRATWNWILGLLIGFSSAIWWSDFFFNRGLTLGLQIFGGIILLLTLPLVLNNTLGPTCTCHLRTAVQLENLGSLVRLRKAQKVLARIQPLIQRAQAGSGPVAQIEPAAPPQMAEAPAAEAAPAAPGPEPPPAAATT